MSDQNPILELPGITVTRESISFSEGELSVDTVERVHIEEGSLPFRESRWLYPRASMLLTCFGAIPLALILPLGPERLSGVINIIWLWESLVVAAVGVCICLALRKQVNFSVQLQTMQGTLTAYQTPDKQEAEQVRHAIEDAMGAREG